MNLLVRHAVAVAIAVSCVEAKGLSLRGHDQQQFSSELCTATQEDDIEYYNGEYDTSSCKVDQCSSDCQDAISGLYRVFPDCLSVDGSNYSELMAQLLDLCSASAENLANGEEVGASGTTTTDENECTFAHEMRIDEALKTYLTDACANTTTCTRECLADLKNLREVLPDCTSSDAINYFADTAEWLSYCDKVGDASIDSTQATNERAKTALKWQKLPRRHL